MSGSGVVTLADALSWPTADKIKLLGTLRSELWFELSRPEQQQPEGDWRIWYLMGGRGSGKSRTGAETFCAWINDFPAGEWAIVAPTFADARDTCVESSSSGILSILGPAVRNWNRSLGEILLADGSKIYLDGADDGALRIQGKNLRGAWCIEGNISVKCRDGDKPIRSVSVGDQVLTRLGWRAVTAHLLTKRGAPLLEITTFDGSSVRCTHDHPIMVAGKGWVRADAIRVGQCLITSPAPRPGMTGTEPDSIVSITATTKAERRVDTVGCTSLSGSTITAGRSRQATSFITATKTVETTARRISNSCRKAITTVITSGERFGIRNRRTGSVPERKSRGRDGRTERSLARSAARSSRPAPHADASLAAPSYARSVVASVSDAGRGDVYDITVEGAHEFFAGGVLVHNCDEIGLWNQWDRAWNESLAFAVRHAPARIVATGTPKMGHGLVKILVDDPEVPKAQMRTSDNIANLNASAVRELYGKYAGTRLGTQELDGEWLEAIEGDMLKRAWWKYYDPQLLGGRAKRGIQVDRLPRFQMILMSIDTPLKDKETSDFVALQAWGVIGADRYLLDTRVERLSYDQCKRAVKEMAATMRTTFRCQHRCLIENAGYGVELIIDLQRELGGIHKISPGAEGNKTMRALAASSDLETGNCFLPGFSRPDLSGPDPERSPAWVNHFVDEAALFPNGPHDDQCFPVGTLVMCPDGPTRIENILVGDTVLGLTGWNHVEEAGQTGIRPVIERFGLTATPDHPIHTRRGWTNFANVRNDDKLLVCDALRKAANENKRSANAAAAATTTTGDGSEAQNADPLGPADALSKDANVEASTFAACANSTTVATFATATPSTSKAPSKGQSRSKPPSSTASPSDAIRTRNRRHTNVTSSPEDSGSRRVFRRFTKKSGNTTTDRSPTDGTSTIKTETTPITRSRTWNAYLRAAMRKNTVKADRSTVAHPNSLRISTESVLSLLNGTDPPKAENGIANTPSTWDSVNTVGEAVPVYNLKTADGTYFADGILVHNCDAWSQAMNWLRSRTGSPMRTASAKPRRRNPFIGGKNR